MKHELEEFRTEATHLKNQQATIRRLEERNRQLEQQVGTYEWKEKWKIVYISCFLHCLWVLQVQRCGQYLSKIIVECVECCTCLKWIKVRFGAIVWNRQTYLFSSTSVICTNLMGLFSSCIDAVSCYIFICYWPWNLIFGPLSCE